MHAVVGIKLVSGDFDGDGLADPAVVDSSGNHSTGSGQALRIPQFFNPFASMARKSVRFIKGHLLPLSRNAKSIRGDKKCNSKPFNQSEPV